MHSHPHQKMLSLSFAIITLFMLAEFVAGKLFGSLALTADAGHMANDSFSLLLALIALRLTSQKQQKLAILNGLSLIAIALYILFEAYQRWQTPTELQALPMLAIASLGLGVNIVVAYLMHDSDHDNLNIRAAYLHVLADLFGSIVAIIAGLAAYFWQWLWVDTFASLLLAIFVLKSGVSIVLAAYHNEHTHTHSHHSH